MATHEVVAVAVATSEAAGAGAVEVSAMEAVPSSSKKRSLPPGAPFPQPRGRPRKDHVWDSMAGEWVPDAEAAANPAAASNGTSMDSGTKAERREARNAKHAAEVDAARRALVMRGVDRLKGHELKALLREADQPLGGSKEELVARYRAYFGANPAAAEATVTALPMGVVVAGAAGAGAAGSGAGATVVVQAVPVERVCSTASLPAVE